MRRTIWIAGLTLSAALMGWHDAAANTSGPITVRVLLESYAKVPTNTLDRAQAEATRLFERAGLTLEWLEAGASPAHCLIIRIISKPIGVNPRALAMTPGATANHGKFAWVYYDRVQASSTELALELAQLLGLVLAHEMGHMLLPYGAHSQVGIMRPEWDRAQVKNAVEDVLTFTPAQAALIGDRLRASVSGTAAR